MSLNVWMIPSKVVLTTGILLVGSATAQNPSIQDNGGTEGNLVQPSSAGPRSKKEDSTLWENGRKNFSKGDFDQAAFFLQRFVDRYPASPGYYDALLLLGISRLRLDQPTRAIDPLKKHINAQPHSLESYRVRLRLGQAYVESGQNKKALFLSEEIKRRSKLPRDVQVGNLILKARANLGLNQFMRAKRALDSFFVELEKQKKDAEPLAGEATLVTLELKARECEQMPGSNKLEEEKVIDLIRRRGTCLLEATLQLKKQIDLGDFEWIEKTGDSLVEAFVQYRNICQRPPLPKAARTKTQVKAYRAELAKHLEKQCSDTIDEASRLVRSFKETSSKGLVRYIETTADQIKGTDS